MKNQIFRAKTVLIAGAFAGFFGPAVHAQSYDQSSIYNGIGTPFALGQGNSAIVNAYSQAVANNACVPTATADGLAYLEAYQQSIGQGTPFSSTPNSYPTVNTLIADMGTTSSGTTTTGQLNGLYNYLSATAPGVTISGQVAPLEATMASFYGSGSFNSGYAANIQAANPTAQYLYSALSGNGAVQLGLLWGSYNSVAGTFTSTGGHEVDLESINTSTKAMTFLDPWGSTTGNAGTSGLLGVGATYTNITLSGSSYTLVYFNNPPPDGDRTGGTEFGFPTAATALILDDTVEIVPEPTVLTLLGGGTLAMLARFRRKS
jgi:hypothetical protein